MTTLNRNYFLSLYHKINSDESYDFYDKDNTEAECIHITKHSLVDVKEQIAKTFSKNGYVLINFEEKLEVMKALDWASNVIGRPSADSSNNGKMYSKIVAEENGKYFANTHYTQPLHTDDAHVLNTPRIITLFCEKSAPKGGVTTLVKFNDIYDLLLSSDQGNEINNIDGDDYVPINRCLSEDDINEFYKNDAMKIEGVKGTLVRPFFYNLEDNARGVVFPAFLSSISASNILINAYIAITKLVHNPLYQIRFKLKEGQLLILDNYRVLHGRTKFNLSDERILYRFCFDAFEGVTVKM